MNSNVLLARVETDRDMYLPLGLMYIADALEKAGFKPTIVHCRYSGMGRFRKAVRELNPLMVGLSIITGRHLLPTIQASRIAHQAGIPVIWGGVHSTVLPELCLSEPFVDAVVIGEGEITFTELAGRIKDEGAWNPASIAQIPGIAIKLDNSVQFGPERDMVGDLDRFIPAYHLVDVPRYYMPVGNRLRGLQVTTSRGCPYNCGFCCIAAILKRRVRKHSVPYMRDMLSRLQSDFGMDAVIFHDDLLFSDVDRIKLILEGQTLPWWGEIRAGQVDDEFATWLKEVHCNTLFVGAESGSQRMLDAIDKRIKVEDISQTAIALNDHNIRSEFSFIQGLPGENDSDRKMTYNLIDRIERNAPLATCGLKFYTPYPKTPLWETSLSGGFQPPQTNRKWSRIDRFHDHLPWLNQIDRNAVIVRNVLIAARSNKTSYKSHCKTTGRARPYLIMRSIYRFVSMPLNWLERTISNRCWRKRRFRFPAAVFIVWFIRLMMDALSGWSRNILKRLLIRNHQ